MKKYKPCILIVLGLMLLQIFSVGCAGRSASSRFYTLNPVMRGDTGTGQRPVVVIEPMTMGIMPIEIPDYLDRPEIVTRNSSMAFRSPSTTGGEGIFATTSPGSSPKPCRQACHPIVSSSFRGDAPLRRITSLPSR